MREVCFHKAEEENFLQIVQGASTANSESPSKCRRLAVHRSAGNYIVETKVENPRLRTLLYITSYEWKATCLFFTRLQMMRVLDLSYVKFEGGKIPSSIGKLIHLRYLSLKWAYVTHLPSSMRNLKQLVYLNLCIQYACELLYMPNILKEMRKLIYLNFPLKIKNEVKMELGNLVRLETLKNFSTAHGSVTDLKGMTRLRTLSIFIRGKGCTMKTLSSSLSKLSYLENIIIDYKLYTPTNDDEEGFVWDFVHLKQLKLWVYMPRLPDEKHFPAHLTNIVLIHCRLKEDPMPILEKLVHLKEVMLGERSFCGKRIVCLRGGFPQLKILQVDELEELEEWIVEEGSMPLLRNLYIGSCEKFKELHRVLQFITSLKDLYVKFQSIILSEEQLPPHLTNITVSGCRLEEDPMPILEKLLHLKELTLSDEPFGGRRMVCSRGGFPQLQKLELWRLEELEEWIVEEGSMPLLHTLRINNCPKLKKLPDGLQFITTLEDLDVHPN
ncbi:hypothetical protein HA466_0021140 [Hirschfeldia incana]|nr:hypothetical protein HA466_0021140 [Hirschfeldia incana]